MQAFDPFCLATSIEDFVMNNLDVRVGSMSMLENGGTTVNKTFTDLKFSQAIATVASSMVTSAVTKYRADAPYICEKIEIPKPPLSNDFLNSDFAHYTGTSTHICACSPSFNLPLILWKVEEQVFELVCEQAVQQN